jgi:hypothetical protein
MSAFAKRLLHAAEARIGATGTTINRTPEEAAHLARWGLSGAPVASMPASDIRTLGQMFDGKFPDTMTQADIAEFGQINELFEKECKWTQKIEC